VNFARKRVKGRTAKTYKEWYSGSGQYRINWRSEVAGVQVDPYYQACVRCTTSGREYWGFAGRRGPYRTLKAAKEACETNRKLWEKLLAVDGRDKVSQIRDLRDRAMIGPAKNTHCILDELPVWVAAQIPQRHLEILCH
jgi:hypothetical protein